MHLQEIGVLETLLLMFCPKHEMHWALSLRQLQQLQSQWLNFGWNGPRTLIFIASFNNFRLSNRQLLHCHHILVQLCQQSLIWLRILTVFLQTTLGLLYQFLKLIASRIIVALDTSLDETFCSRRCVFDGDKVGLLEVRIRKLFCKFFDHF